MTSKREFLHVRLCLTRKKFPSYLSHFILLYLVLQITGSTSENQPSSDNSAADNPRNRSTSENQPRSDNSAADNQRNRSTPGNLAKDDNSAADHAFEVSSCMVPVVEDETDDDLLLAGVRFYVSQCGRNTGGTGRQNSQKKEHKEIGGGTI